MKQKIRGLLFDKDGTLFDFRKSFAPWVSSTLRRYANGDDALAGRLADAVGFDLANTIFRPESVIIAGTPGEIAHSLSPHLPDMDFEALLDDLVDSSVDAPQIEAVPLVPLFERFRSSGLTLGISTNDAETPARAHLDSAGVLHFFDFVSGYDSGFGGKPEPGMQHAFCKHAGLEPSQVAMIGDSSHDLVAGRAAGMTCIGVLTGIASRDDLAPLADHVLNDIGQLPDFLKLGSI